MREAGDDIPGFPVAFDRRGTRETVLLGVIPVGQVIENWSGRARYCWWLNLPMLGGVRVATSLDRAHRDIRDTIAQWLDAASAPHVERTLTREDGRPAAARSAG